MRRRRARRRNSPDRSRTRPRSMTLTWTPLPPTFGAGARKEALLTSNSWPVINEGWKSWFHFGVVIVILGHCWWDTSEGKKNQTWEESWKLPGVVDGIESGLSVHELMNDARGGLWRGCSRNLAYPLLSQIMWDGVSTDGYLSDSLLAKHKESDNNVFLT